jgi:hypothetical protein
LKPLIEPKDCRIAKNIAALVIVAVYSAFLLHIM